MRFDKLTTKFQQALADAQSMALGNDNGFIEPQHLLSACLRRTTAARRRCSPARASPCRAAGGAEERDRAACRRSRARAARSAISRDLNNLLNLTDKEATKRGDQFIASELFLLALTDDKGDTGRLLKEAGADAEGAREAIEAVRGGASVDSQEAEGQREALKSTRSTSPSARAKASSTR